MKKTNKSTLSVVHFALPFAISVFLGAFLLFQVQPIISKYILPWFGGSSSVWVTSVLFFEVMLLFGYFYAYIITKFPLKKQIVIHGSILVFTAIMLFFLFFLWNSPITPPLFLKPPDAVPPVLQVFFILTLSVGLPYFMLSTTSSLLQRWYSYVENKNSPYRLYALSNAGSLIGILSYPFLFEIFLTLRIQGIGWALGFLVYTAFLLWISRITIKNAVLEKQHTKADALEMKESTTATAKLYWVLLPFLSSVILLATTAKITQAVAPVPFLWLVPLAIYLLSFILCFDSSRWYWRWFYPFAFLITAFLAVWITFDMQSVSVNFSTFAAFLFTSFMLLHGELYRVRPEPKKLNLYYFLIALGGALGGVMVAIIAPLIFSDFWELYIGIFLVAVIAIVVINSVLTAVLQKVHQSKKHITIANYIFLSVASIALIATNVYFFSTYASDTSETKKIRNFYGTIGIRTESDDYGDYKVLFNGDINHGSQYLSEDLSMMPTQYYGQDSGAGLAITNNKKSTALHVGVVGLGVGTLATYGKPGDTYVFYEINPSVIDVANTDFSYLKNSKADVSVVLGDARLSMEKEIKKGHKPYNVLLVDAFTDDAIPAHLLTKEAFATYLSLLDKQDGILGIHISNRYLDLYPVIHKLAEHYGLSYAYIESNDDEYEIASASWVLLAVNPDALSGRRITNAKSEYDDVKKVDLWTDDYSNLFQVLEVK